MEISIGLHIGTLLMPERNSYFRLLVSWNISARQCFILAKIDHLLQFRTYRHFMRIRKVGKQFRNEGISRSECDLLTTSRAFNLIMIYASSITFMQFLTTNRNLCSMSKCVNSCNSTHSTRNAVRSYLAWLMTSELAINSHISTATTKRCLLEAS